LPNDFACRRFARMRIEISVHMAAIIWSHPRASLTAGDAESKFTGHPRATSGRFKDQSIRPGGQVVRKGDAIGLSVCLGIR
jgi:hypothetical protein